MCPNLSGREIASDLARPLADRHRACARRSLCSFLAFPGLLNALRWQRLAEAENLGNTLANHLDGIAVCCDHPARFGVVESTPSDVL